MLKIDQHTIAFRPRDKRLTPHLALALLIAFALHLFFYLLFPITPIAFEEPKIILPLISVLTDAPIGTVAKADTSEPPIPIPSSLFATEREPVPTSRLDSPLPVFPSAPSPPPALPENLLEKQTLPPQRVTISALEPWEDALLLDENLKIDLPPLEDAWTFDFGFDGSTGKILWLHPRSPSIPEGLWSLADHIAISSGPQEGVHKGVLFVEVR